MYNTDEIKTALISNLAEKIILAKIAANWTFDTFMLEKSYHEALEIIQFKVKEERKLMEHFKKEKESANL